MNYAPMLIAIIIAVFEIFAHRDIKDRLRKERPDVPEDGFYPSNGFMYILIIVELVNLITYIIKEIRTS